jgi:hypothetical protein
MSHGWRKACQAMGLKPKRTRPCTPPTNAKAEAERFIEPKASAKQWTLLEEWAYAMLYRTPAARNALLPA